ncbi:helix-turn-helix domain-containing protein [Ruoffia sp. FAM 20858]|uniref:helix-turn-helix domain-containing protein n=1 Tax=Ruoffia sp. FAM 20858 TaxID=3259516 RepID=UPI0038863860
MNKYNVSLDDLGARIRNIRVNIAKMTMDEFADKIKDQSNEKVSPGKSNVSRWERGKNLPNDLTLKSIADIGGKSVNELLYGSLTEYSRSIMLEDISNGGKFYETLFEHYLKNKEVESVNKDELIDYINNNYEEVYTKMEALLKENNIMRLMGASNKISYLNSKGFDEDSNEVISAKAEFNATKEYIYNKSFSFGEPELIIEYAILAVKDLLPYEKTFEESYDDFKERLRGFSLSPQSNFTIKRNITLYKEQGFNQAEAKEKAINRYYRSQMNKIVNATINNVNDLYKEFKNIDN